MKRIYALPSFGFVVLLSFSKSYGQATIDAEFRPRSEFRSGFNQPLLDVLKSEFITMQRTRLNFNYKSSAISSRLVLQDARIFGETNTKQPSTASNGSVGVYEAWTNFCCIRGPV